MSEDELSIATNDLVEIGIHDIETINRNLMVGGKQSPRTLAVDCSIDVLPQWKLYVSLTAFCSAIQGHGDAVHLHPLVAITDQK